MCQRLTFVIHEGVALTITMTASADVYAQYEYDMQQTLYSLNLLP